MAPEQAMSEFRRLGRVGSHPSGRQARGSNHRPAHESSWNGLATRRPKSGLGDTHLGNRPASWAEGRSEGRSKGRSEGRPKGRLLSKPWNLPEVRAIQVPLSLLLSRRMTPAAKLLWIRLHFDQTHRSACSPRARQLAKRTSLGRSTVYFALRRGAAEGWFVRRYDPVTGKLRWEATWPHEEYQEVVHIPVDLIRAAHKLRPQAILCYGLLQALHDFNGRSGWFKWGELKELTGLNLRTIKRAVRALAEARWIATAQKDRRARIWFSLQDADEAYRLEVQKQLEQAEFKGETLMRCYLSLIVDTNESEDRARPEFLVNPASGERMELDRFYPVHRVAFEFNGKQHYVAAGSFTKQEVAAQKRRDRLKHQICKEKGIRLVVVHAEDLSLVGMLRKVGNLLPRQALRGLRRTIKFLNRCGLRYQAASVT